MPPHHGGRWAEKFSRSGYFFVAVLLHLTVFVMVATWIIWPAVPAPQEPPGKVDLPIASPPPPPVVVPQTPLVVNPAHDALPSSPVTPIQRSGGPAMEMPLPGIDNNLPPSLSAGATGPAGPIHQPQGMSPERKEKIKETLIKWGVTDDGNTQTPAAKFSIYVAAYADGDWNCNTVTKDGAITAGSIPNLLEKIREWSHGATKGEVMTKPLQIGSPDLLEVMPPFIFFTGHKDFVLTDQEIMNLRNYLHNGGAIWGDNALAGEGSRFDVAFRREMRRVIPDKDKDFAPLDLSHDIFTKGKFRMEEIPQGMNYYAETIEHIDLDGKLAILYTPNDYSDMMFFRILPGDKAADPMVYATPSHPLYTSGALWNGSRVYYRNFDMKSALTVERLGMDIVAHLLTRFGGVLEDMN